MPKRELSHGLGIPLSLDFKSAPRDAMALITVSDGLTEKSVLISHLGTLEIDADKYLQAPKERLKPKQENFKTFLNFGAKGAAWFFISVLLSVVALTTTHFMSMQVVLTGSMEPTIKPGDVVLALKPDRLAPEVGSIVTYTGRRIDGSAVATFTHRIIDGDAINGFTVKGDANKDPDVQKPKLDDINGVIFLVIPLLGKLLSPKVMMMILLAGFGIWLIVDAFREDD